MRKLNWFVRSLFIVAFVVMGSLFIVPMLATASAHTLESAHTTTSASPKCTGSVSAYPGTTTVAVNQTATINVTWSCESGAYVVTDVVWADGVTTSYTCWSNCVSGSQPMQHTYSKKGTYYPYIYMGGNASGFTSVKIIVK